MAAADWDPDLYERFKAQRARPFHDLAGMVRTDRPISRMVDLGCGTGELTAELVEELNGSRALGIDNSPAMLEKAAVHASDRLSFAAGDLASWSSDADHDLVFSNAALQWVPDHHLVLARWARALVPQGQLAVQVPANGDHPAYLIAGAIAGTGPFASAIGPNPPHDPSTHDVLPPEQYATLLHDLGFAEQEVLLRVYDHVLPSTEAVVDWIRGTNLRRFLGRMPADLHEPYVDAVRAAIVADLGDRRPFFFPFRRILLWGRRP